MKKEKAEKPFDVESRRKWYLWGGLAFMAVGVLFCLLNVVLDVPDYQKVSTFNAFFLVAGGALGLAVATPRTDEEEKHSWSFKNGWRFGSVVVMGSFGLCLRSLMEEGFIDSTSLMLLIALLGAYFLFLYLIRLKDDDEKSVKHTETAEVLVVAIALAISIKAVGVQAFKIPSGSMLHTLEVGDHLLITKFMYGIPLPYTDARLPAIRDPERGDVVVFSYPGMDNPDRPPFQQPEEADVLKGQDFIKRVIGLPGETVELKGNRLYVNGAEVREPWAQYLDGHGDPLPVVYRSRGPLADYGPALIPPDMYLVMGDNRFHSNDGRIWGFVKKGRIKGKAAVIYWSFAGLSRIGTLIK